MFQLVLGSFSSDFLIQNSRVFPEIQGCYRGWAKLSQKGKHPLQLKQWSFLRGCLFVCAPVRHREQQEQIIDRLLKMPLLRFVDRIHLAQKNSLDLKFRRCRCPFPYVKIVNIPYTWKAHSMNLKSETLWCSLFASICFPPFWFIQIWGFCKHKTWQLVMATCCLLMDSEMELVMALPNWPVACFVARSCEMKLRGMTFFEKDKSMLHR